MIIARVPDLPDWYSRSQPDEPADVIIVSVRHHHQSQPPDSVLVKRPPELSRIGSPIDQDGLTIGGH
jgi:hypothetical protein